jgi:hypothetical protein
MPSDCFEDNTINHRSGISSMSTRTVWSSLPPTRVRTQNTFCGISKRSMVTMLSRVIQLVPTWMEETRNTHLTNYG